MSKPTIHQTSTLQAATESEMEDSNRASADKDTTIHSMLLLIQKKLVNLKEERKADKKEILVIISELAKILRKEIVCEIETRLDSIPSTLFACVQRQRSEECRTISRSCITSSERSEYP